METEDQQRLRFQVELEFVQCLANPNYLNFLAQRGYFKDTAFINYLKYLQYWKEPLYAKYLKVSGMPRIVPGVIICPCTHGQGELWAFDTLEISMPALSTGIRTKHRCQQPVLLKKANKDLTEAMKMFFGIASDRYPMCLHFLELLQYEHFRKEIVSAQCAKFIDDQQILHWQHYTRKRMRLLQSQADQNQAQAAK